MTINIIIENNKTIAPKFQLRKIEIQMKKVIVQIDLVK